MIEKGKDPIVGKLRRIQLIKADLQLVMRIVLNQNKYYIKKDPRVLKSSFGSRLLYSIEIVILQKRIIYNNSKLINQVIVHNITDLEICYDR